MMAESGSGRRWLRFLPLLIGLLVTLTAGVGGAFFIAGIMDEPPAPPKQIVQQVRLIRPPPPPEEYEPPPPPEMEEKVDVPEPETPTDTPADDSPPPGDLLSLDAAGVAGVDGFGLGSKPHGRDLLASSSGSRFNWYAGVLKDDLLSFLSDYEELRKRAYQVDLKLWLNADGTVRRVDLKDSTGNQELDQQLRNRLASLDRIGESPPEGLPQPIEIRIVSRM